MDTNFPGKLAAGSNAMSLDDWRDVGALAQEHLGGKEEMPW